MAAMSNNTNESRVRNVISDLLQANVNALMATSNLEKYVITSEYSCLSCAKQDRLNEHLHIITQTLMEEWMNKQLESGVIDAAKCSVSEQSS